MSLQEKVLTKKSKKTFKKWFSFGYDSVLIIKPTEVIGKRNFVIELYNTETSVKNNITTGNVSNIDKTITDAFLEYLTSKSS